jgi:hypothetical protein
MTTDREFKCKCGGQLMPVWRNTKWYCIQCTREQNLPKDSKVVDNRYK